MSKDLERIVVIGTSAGGIDALKTIVPAFQRPANYAVFLVIHISSKTPNLLPFVFSDDSTFQIKEALAGQRIEKEHIYIAPPDYHLCVERGYISLSNEPPQHFSRPSIDVLFESAAYSYGEQVVALLLTGANEDGALGLKKVKDKGGITIVEDPEEAKFPYMPRAALDLLTPDHVLDLEGIKKFLLTFNKTTV